LYSVCFAEATDVRLQCGEGGAGGLQRVFDLGRAVGGTDEAGLVERRREVDAAVQHRVEEAVEALLVDRDGAGVVVRQHVGEEEAEQAALAVDRHRDAGGVGLRLQAVDQLARARAERLVEAGLGDLVQRRQAAGGGDGVARQRARLVGRAERRELRHDLARRAERRQRHAAADDLAEHADVGHEAGDLLRVEALRAAERHAEAGHHLVHDQQRAVLVAKLAQPRHERHAGAHEVHVAGDRLDDHAGQLVAVGREGLLELLDVVEVEHGRVLHDLGRHAGRGRDGRTWPGRSRP
jgi:hypothetical protein